MAAALPLAVKAILASYLTELQMRELLWLLSLGELSSHESITTKTLPGFVVALHLFPGVDIFHFERPAESYRDFMWSGRERTIRVDYRVLGQEEPWEVIRYGKADFIRVFSG